MTNLNNRALSNLIAASERYLGGYLFGGTTVALAGTAATFEQVVYGFGPVDEPTQADRARNKAILAQAPVGAEVVFQTRLSGYEAFAAYRKEGPCRWKLVEDWEEEFDE